MTPGKASAERRFARAAQPPVRERGLGDGDRLTDRIVAAIQAEIPAFAELEASEVRRIVASDVTCRPAATAAHRLPTPQELDVSSAATLALARAGVPLDAINQSRRIAALQAFDAWREDADARGVDAATQVDQLHSLWSWTDAIAARASAVYPRTESELEDRDEGQRAWFLRSVLDGTLAPTEAQARAAAYGLLPGGRYLAIRGRPGPDQDARQLRRALERTTGVGSGGALVGTVEGEVWGVVSRRPELAAGQGVVGAGTAAELSAVDGSFRLATRALETAMAFGLQGLVGIDDLSLRPVILSEDHLGGRLVRRYLDPLRELGEFGATLEHTMRTYLANDMRIDETAKALIIHPNTLRHRIERFQQLTGADLRRTEDVIEVWWALQRRRIAG